MVRRVDGVKVAFIGAILGEEKAVDYFLQVGLVTSLFCVTSLVVGYAVPRIAGLTVPQSIASGFEIGIHNSTLAIAVALTVLENTTMAIPSAIYGIVMFPIAAIFGFVLVRMVRPPADSTAKAACPARGKRSLGAHRSSARGP